jgi:hypothetical protein
MKELHVLLAYLDKGIKVYHQGTKEACERVRAARIKRTPEHSCPTFIIDTYQRYVQRDKEESYKQEQARAKRVKAGQAKAAATRAKNKKSGRKPNFILCPTCDGKSKLLRTEMGGLQTRQCKLGHLFEVDMFFGFESNKRRIEQFDRPYFCPTGGDYNDWVVGRFKNDPTGKGQK